MKILLFFLIIFCSCSRQHIIVQTATDNTITELNTSFYGYVKLGHWATAKEKAQFPQQRQIVEALYVLEQGKYDSVSSILSGIDTTDMSTATHEEKQEIIGLMQDIKGKIFSYKFKDSVVEHLQKVEPKIGNNYTKQYLEVTFYFHPITQHPIISLCFNEKRYNFILDTGAELSIITPKFSELVKNYTKIPFPIPFVISNISDTSRAVPVNEVVFLPIHIANTKDCLIDNILLEAYPFVIPQSLPNQQQILRRRLTKEIHGIIGWDIIRQFSWDFRIAEGKVIISDKQIADTTVANFCDTLVTTEKIAFTMGRVNGIRVPFFVDTGANSTNVGESFKYVMPDAYQSATTKTLESYTIQGKVIMEKPVYKNISIQHGNSEIFFPEITETVFDSVSSILLRVTHLGSDVMRSSERFVIDPLAGKIGFVPKKNAVQ